VPEWTYRRGLHDLGRGCFAWLQPDGSWGWSNAGLIADGGSSLLVDTLFDLPLTREMLDAMKGATPAAARIDVLVNTHANGDHCYGNELVPGARILASRACAEEMAAVPPELLAGLMDHADQLGPAGEMLRSVFAPFDFRGITPTPPTETFEGTLECAVGDKRVELIEVGPAHTRGDVLVHVPGDRVLYTGDILFVDAHPIVWEGPVSNWVRACDRILALDVETVVPGHGPITDLRGVARLRDYLVHIEREARRCFDAGLSVRDACREIALEDYEGWGDAERIAVNVHTLYREIGADETPPNPVELFGLMAELRRTAS
jgi:glyoxylase-like metal-dependent hydrolase (beta-lactamase superfamily II)